MQQTLVKDMHRKIVIEISESVHWSRRCCAISFI